MSSKTHFAISTQNLNFSRPLHQPSFCLTSACCRVITTDQYHIRFRTRVCFSLPKNFEGGDVTLHQLVKGNLLELLRFHYNVVPSAASTLVLSSSPG